MRFPQRALLGLCLWTWTFAVSGARADEPTRVLLALGSEQSSEIVAVELSVRGWEVVTAEPIAGRDIEARHREAHALAERGAQAVAYLEGAEVHVVTSRGICRATLPAAAQAEERAIIVLSVLDECTALPSSVSETPSVAALVSPVLVSPVPVSRDLASSGLVSSPASTEPHEGVHVHATVEAAGVLLWARLPSATDNELLLVQRVGVGVLAGAFHGEAVGFFGLDQGLDHAQSQGAVFGAFLSAGASLHVGEGAVELQGLVGFFVHELLSASETGPFMPVLQAGAAAGMSLPDSRARFPFRTRLEAGVYIRPSPERVGPFLSLVFGIAFW